jgi:hypothetical protein
VLRRRLRARRAAFRARAGQVLGLSPGAVPTFDRRHAGEALRHLIEKREIRIAIKTEGDAMQAVSMPETENVEWLVQGEPHGVLYRLTRIPRLALVAGHGTAHLVYVSSADMVRVLEPLMPQAPQEAPALDLITAKDGKELLTFDTALRVLDGYRDLWSHLVSASRHPALHRLDLPESAAGALAAVAIGDGLTFYARDADKEWRPVGARGEPLLITIDGWPLGYVALSYHCRFVAAPIAVPAAAFLATLDSLRAKKAAREAARARDEAARQCAGAEAERAAAEARAQRAAEEAEMQAALTRMAEAEPARRRHALAQAVAEKMVIPEA